MSNLSAEERKMKFKKLSDDLNIELIKENRNFILYVKDYISNGKNLNKKPIDFSMKTNK